MTAPILLCETRRRTNCCNAAEQTWLDGMPVKRLLMQDLLATMARLAEWHLQSTLPAYCAHLEQE
jgi:hypothetical protein